MPELPEVETIRTQLEKYLVGHKIEDVEVRNSKIFTGDKKNLLNTKITAARRFAKVLSIDLANGYSIVIHVKLTGQLIYRSIQEHSDLIGDELNAHMSSSLRRGNRGLLASGGCHRGPNLSSKGELSSKVVGGLGGRHTHVIFSLDKGGFLYYNDVRRFGWIKVVETKEVEKLPFIGKLGPEPFKGLSQKLFAGILSKSGRPIKIVLMDQEKIGGIGNIYANDALWLSKINPKTPANKLTTIEQKKLYEAILEVLKKGLKYGGASELAFVTPEGREGEYQNHTLVYGHEGEPCGRCHKAKIEKYFLGGRGTYVCPVCQG